MEISSGIVSDYVEFVGAAMSSMATIGMGFSAITSILDNEDMDLVDKLSSIETGVGLMSSYMLDIMNSVARRQLAMKAVLGEVDFDELVSMIENDSDLDDEGRAMLKSILDDVRGRE